jgi:hypothetical protein
MIYLSSLEAIIESIYLEDSLSGKIGECNVFVNPDNVKYITSKTIIISVPDYDVEKIKELLRNGCKIISRVYYDMPEIEISPYILRVNFGMMWNGKIIKDSYQGSRNLIDTNSVEYNNELETLYFPQIYSSDIKATDQFGNLTSLGWALQQVGVNVKTNTPFVNLDILKTGKVEL